MKTLIPALKHTGKWRSSRRDGTAVAGERLLVLILIYFIN